jgi:hypothetical protein
MMKLASLWSMRRRLRKSSLNLERVSSSPCVWQMTTISVWLETLNPTQPLIGPAKLELVKAIPVVVFLTFAHEAFSSF